MDPHPLKNRLAFIVEDDPINVSVLSMTLQQLGAQILFERYAGNVVKKLKDVSPSVPDIILLDYHLPHKKTGFDVYKEIKKHPEFKDIPAVIVTAADPDPLLPEAKELGLRGLITKPIRRSSFAIKLKAILEGEYVWLEREF